MSASLARGNPDAGEEFNRLALALFARQREAVPIYRELCDRRGAGPDSVRQWWQIPALPTSAFKEHEVSSIPAAGRARVFHSSGTAGQAPSRHFHSAETLALYEASLLPWFERHFFASRQPPMKLFFLTPKEAPHSSLVHMFETIRQKLGAPKSAFAGQIDAEGRWTLDIAALLAALDNNPQSAIRNPQLILGTAFSFVHLLDFLTEKNLRFNLPAGSRVMETGGYKNRSRSMPKAELHALITDRLGIPPGNIVSEYGMCELSSQAYDTSRLTPRAPRLFHFPPWARAQVISPETGQEVSEGEPGLIRVFDLANVFSVMAIQTEDLAICRSDGFELIGRAQPAEPRGCSLMSVEALKR